MFFLELHTESATIAVKTRFTGAHSENTERQVTIGSRAIYTVDGLNKKRLKVMWVGEYIYSYE